MSGVRTSSIIPEHYRGHTVHMVGIKGTGMSSLAVLLHQSDVTITGSDSGESFYTDAVLERLGIPVRPTAGAPAIGPDVGLVVFSTAYDPARHPELVAARERGIPTVSYPEALGEISALTDASGIAGSHGKTTTTALCAVLCRALRLPATVIVPTLLPDLGGMPVYAGGSSFLIAETCEYRRSFLHFRPRRVVLTTVEPEHLDYYRDAHDVELAFAEYLRLLPPGGVVIYNADDEGCTNVVSLVADRADIRSVPYGRLAEGEYRMSGVSAQPGSVRFDLAGAPEHFELHVPGEHNAHNAAAALCLVLSLAGSSLEHAGATQLHRARAALREFRGSRRRAEIVGSAGEILVLDDYAHHPTEIARTLGGLRSFYSGRRLVLDFMPHTYSRTRALFGQFVRCFGDADEVILHEIYASAREQDEGSVSGAALAAEVARVRPNVRFYPSPMDALEYVVGSVRPGDLFVTMGAGDNWKLGKAVLERLRAAPGGEGAAT